MGEGQLGLAGNDGVEAGAVDGLHSWGGWRDEASSRLVVPAHLAWHSLGKMSCWSSEQTGVKIIPHLGKGDR